MNVLEGKIVSILNILTFSPPKNEISQFSLPLLDNVFIFADFDARRNP